MNQAVPKALPTLSVGVAIGHYADHLQVLLDRGRDAEKAAKKNRNSLAVSYSAHSGGGDTRTVDHSWSINPVRDRWWLAINAFRLDAVPDGAIYELDTLARELTNLAKVNANRSSGIVVPEATRILSRKRTQEGRLTVHPWFAREFKQRLASQPPDEAICSLRQMVNELYIARKILPGVNLGGDSALARWTNGEKGPGVSLVPPSFEFKPAVEEGT